MHDEGSTVEEWRPVAWTGGWYEVSDLGRVRSWRVNGGNDRRPNQRAATPRLVRTPTNPRGYATTALYDAAGRRRSVKVHRLVLEAFVGLCPPGMEACHRNDARADNRLANLRWDTHHNNVRDAVRSGAMARGAKLRAKLTPADVAGVRAMSLDGASASVIARAFGVSKSCIIDVLNGRCHGATPAAIATKP